MSSQASTAAAHHLRHGTFKKRPGAALLQLLAQRACSSGSSRCGCVLAAPACARTTTEQASCTQQGRLTSITKRLQHPRLNAARQLQQAAAAAAAGELLHVLQLVAVVPENDERRLSAVAAAVLQCISSGSMQGVDHKAIFRGLRQQRLTG